MATKTLVNVHVPKVLGVGEVAEYDVTAVPGVFDVTTITVADPNMSSIQVSAGTMGTNSILTREIRCTMTWRVTFTNSAATGSDNLCIPGTTLRMRPGLWNNAFKTFQVSMNNQSWTTRCSELAQMLEQGEQLQGRKGLADSLQFNIIDPIADISDLPKVGGDLNWTSGYGGGLGTGDAAHWTVVSNSVTETVADVTATCSIRAAPFLMQNRANGTPGFAYLRNNLEVTGTLRSDIENIFECYPNPNAPTTVSATMTSAEFAFAFYRLTDNIPVPKFRAGLTYSYNEYGRFTGPASASLTKGNTATLSTGVITQNLVPEAWVIAVERPNQSISQTTCSERITELTVEYGFVANNLQKLNEHRLYEMSVANGLDGYTWKQWYNAGSYVVIRPANIGGDQKDLTPGLPTQKQWNFTAEITMIGETGTRRLVAYPIFAKSLTVEVDTNMNVQSGLGKLAKGVAMHPEVARGAGFFSSVGHALGSAGRAVGSAARDVANAAVGAVAGHALNKTLEAMMSQGGLAEEAAMAGAGRGGYCTGFVPRHPRIRGGSAVPKRRRGMDIVIEEEGDGDDDDYDDAYYHQQLRGGAAVNPSQLRRNIDSYNNKMDELTG